MKTVQILLICFTVGFSTLSAQKTTSKGETKIMEAGVDFLGKHEYAQFREQNVIRTNSGRVVVIAQGRDISEWPDRSGQDLVCKWSDDSGKTWSELQLMSEHGKQSICPNASVYDAVNNRIFTLYNLFLWPYDDAKSRNTMEGSECKQFLVYSDDEGNTWSMPKEISHFMKTNKSPVIFGSGEGIQLENSKNTGRLIIPGGDQRENRFVYAIYSDDFGETWKCGENVPNPNNLNVACETAMEELSNGNLILLSRSFGHKMKSFSSDSGSSWLPFSQDTSLVEISCNTGLLSFRNNNQDLLVTSFPAGHELENNNGEYVKGLPAGKRRVNGVLYVSFDNGKSWPVKKVVTKKRFAYSSLIQLSNGNLGLFYESVLHWRGSYKNILFKEINIAELLK